MTNTPGPSTALVLSGGGARGAYQVGVLRGLLDLGVIPRDRSAFDLLVGNSAGSINAGMLAAHADRFAEGVHGLEHLWGTIEPGQVFRTDLKAMGGIGARWIRDLSFGGAFGGVHPKALLDTTPLRGLFENTIDFDHIQKNVDSGALRALVIAATDLHTSDGVLFMHGAPELESWVRPHRYVERARIRAEHLMASSAIPIFFPSVAIDDRHFGDGCIRNTAPLSPAIQLGAERIVAIGVRATGAARRKKVAGKRRPPSIAQVAGVLLDAVMLDSIEIDVEHSARVNRSVMAGPDPDPENGFRQVDVLWLSPSRPFSQIAAEMSDRIPGVVRYLMRGLGSDDATTELTSYLLFDSEFCSRLMEIGRADVETQRDDIMAFFDGQPLARAS